MHYGRQPSAAWWQHASLLFHSIPFSMTHLYPSSPSHACPGCNITFPSPDHIAEHLNSETLCWPQDMHTKRLPVPPTFIHREKPRAQGEGPTVASFHLKSGYIYGCAPNLLEKMEENEFNHCCAHSVYYPFKDHTKWELEEFLCWLLSASDTECLLKLQWVSGHIFKLDVFHQEKLHLSFMNL